MAIEHSLFDEVELEVDRCRSQLKRRFVPRGWAGHRVRGHRRQVHGR
jgi:hypothetical protein